MTDNDQNLLTLDADLAKFAKVINLAPKVVTRRVVADLHTRIAKRTPVDTGRARASWDVKQGSPSDYQPPITVGSVKKKGKTDLGAGLAGSAKDVSAGIASIDGTQVVFVTTALDYVQYLETGSSKQAPAGMVRLSIAEVEIEIESIIDQLT